jgi:hypothetical protein
VATDDVRDFMAEDHGDIGIRRGVGEHPRIETDLATGHGD